MQPMNPGRPCASWLSMSLASLIGLSCEGGDTTRLTTEAAPAGLGEVRSGLLLVAGADPESDVAGVQVSISRCGEAEPIVLADLPLEDNAPLELLTTGGLLQNPGADHIFADTFQLLEPGCYDVRAQPVNAQGASSEVCAAAVDEDVAVPEVGTAEVLLLIQCAAPGGGALDALAVLNHPPSILNISFHAEDFAPSTKFICGTTGGFCALAGDVDEGPGPLQIGPGYEFVLDVPDGCTAEQVDVGPSRVGCFDVTCPQPGRVDLHLTVFDLGEGRVRIEDLLAQHGTPGASRAELTFPLYFENVLFRPDNDGDGFGDVGGAPTPVCASEPPPGFVADSSDCNDGDPTISPAAAEICGNGLDDDCNTEIDEPGDCPSP